VSAPAGPSAREAILEAVRAARPPAVARPAARDRAAERGSGEPTLLDEFVNAATVAGASVVVAEAGDVARLARGAGREGSWVYSLVREVPSTVATGADPSHVQPDPHALASLELFVCPSKLGVAENGAVWIAPADGWQRAALFLAQRVVIVVSAESIVADLHEAYARIDVRARPFGVFVSGPSKTADIEQSLVIGAHGPKELTVIVVAPPV
jgi:L-lactate dehydrogenase complex protein LldG